MSKILITGATGTIGSAAAHAALEAGLDVRIGVRRPDKARAYADRGAHVVPLDYEKPDAVEAAFDGVERVFLLTPFVEDFLSLVRPAVEAAKTAGVKHMVRMSALGADPGSEDGLSRQHGESEQLVKNSGLGWTIIQPTFFMDNVVNYQGEAIKAQGAFYGASRGGKTAYVASADVGAVVARLLADPARHAAETHVLTGPEPLADEEVARILTDVLGRDVKYVDLEPDQFAAGMVQNGLPRWAASHMVALEGVKAQGWAARVSPSVEKILGRPAEPFRSFAERHVDRLR